MNWRILKGLCVLILGSVSSLAQPVIQSLSPSGDLVWTNPVPGSFSTIERATNISGPWLPFFYEVATNGTLTTRLPTNAAFQSFYRIKVHTNAPDPSLVMHLPFDNEFASGTVVDISGHGNHGLRYGKPSTPTNWPSLTLGPDGSQAAEFHYYFDGYGLYGRTGDYIGIPASSKFQNLTQATISVWAHYFTSPGGDITYDHNSTLLNSGKDLPGTWFLGRNYSSSTSFQVMLNSSSVFEPVIFPDTSPTGNSGGWHHYLVTFDGGTVVGYFDGKPIVTNFVGVSALTMAGTYLGVGVWTFNATPELDLSVDLHPNNAWINGSLDDIRIYNRSLSNVEVAALYGSFDKLAPLVPANLSATPVSSSQILLRWTPATDLFGIAGYIIRRNGSVVATNVGVTWFDEGLDAHSNNSYTVQAFDPGSNLSLESGSASAVTLAPGTVDMVLDNSDDQPWVKAQGGWRSITGWPGFFGTNSLFDFKTTKGFSLTFRPPLPEPGQYSVYIRYPGLASDTWQVSTAVPVDVVHQGQTNIVNVNQRINYGTWFPLGQFTFDAGTNSFIRIRTEGTDGFFVLGDAIRLVKF